MARPYKDTTTEELVKLVKQLTHEEQKALITLLKSTRKRTYTFTNNIYD